MLICGMGGELICDIIERGKELLYGGAWLILQPMTREVELRRYLCDGGYEIYDETLLEDAGRLYTVIAARYTGDKFKYSAEELLLGRKNIEKRGELFYRLCARKKLHTENLLKSDRYTGEDVLLDETLSGYLREEGE